MFAHSNLLHTVTITNLGPSAASTIVVTDTLPVGVTFVSANAQGVNSSGKVSWAVSSLSAITASNLSVTITAPATGPLTNSAKVLAVTPDSNPNNNTNSLVTSVAPLPVAGPIAVTGGTAKISWNAVSGPTYSVLWSTNISGPYTPIATGLTTSPYTDSVNTNLPVSFYILSSTNAYPLGQAGTHRQQFRGGQQWPPFLFARR